MQQLPGRRALALVAALALASAGSAFAQDTTEAGGARFDTTAAGAGAIDTAGADTSAKMGSDTSAANDKAVLKAHSEGLVATTWLFGTLACAGGSANEDDTAAAPQQDTAQVTEPPPGYSGMERDTTIFPPDSGQAATPEQVENQTTGTYEDTASDTTQGDAYREERPPAADSAAHDSHDSMDHPGAEDTTGQTPDTTQ